MAQITERFAMLMHIVAVAFGILMSVGFSAVTFSAPDTTPLTPRKTQALWGYALAAVAFPAILTVFFAAGTRSEKLVEIYTTTVGSFCAFALVFLIALAVRHYLKKRQPV